MKTKMVAVAVLAFAATIAGVAMFQHECDVAYYESEPEIKNCPTKQCQWIEITDAGDCVQNCQKEVPPIWTGTNWNCPASYNLVADENEALAGLPAAHCVSGVE